MENIKFGINMERWRSDRIYTVEISKETFDKFDGWIPEDAKVEIFGGAVVYGYGLLGYEFVEIDGKYFTRYRMGDSCD